jgi:AcrR family transcriptional regulator
MLQTSKADPRRDAIVHCTGTLIARDGYGIVTVTEITRSAGIPRSSFYSFFENKQAAFRVVLENGIADILLHARVVSETASDCRQRIDSALEDILISLVAQPDFTRLAFVEAQVAGPQIMVSVHCAIAQQSQFLFERVGKEPIVAQVIGSIYFAIYDAVTHGQSESLPELLPELVELAVTPYSAASRDRRG